MRRMGPAPSPMVPGSTGGAGVPSLNPSPNPLSMPPIMSGGTLPTGAPGTDPSPVQKINPLEPGYGLSGGGAGVGAPAQVGLGNIAPRPAPPSPGLTQRMANLS